MPIAAPCHRRAAEVEGYDEATEQLLEADAAGDGWVSTAEASSSKTVQDAAIPDFDDGSNAAAANAEDDVPDIDDLAIEDEDDEVNDVCEQSAICIKCTVSTCNQPHAVLAGVLILGRDSYKQSLMGANATQLCQACNACTHCYAVIHAGRCA